VYGNPDLIAMQVRHALAVSHSGTDVRVPGRKYSQMGVSGWGQAASSSRTRGITWVP
jgi:hypothetical protein